MQMKVTTSAGPAKSSRLTVAPVAGSGSAKCGADVPNASMDDSIAMPARLALVGTSLNVLCDLGGKRVKEIAGRISNA